MPILNLGKYRSIVLAIGIFVVLIAGVMTLNFRIASQLASDAVGINVAGRQRMLSQRLVKELQNLEATAREGKDIARPMQDLKETVATFDTTLAAFMQGGTAPSADGSKVQIDKVESEGGQQALRETFKLWHPFKTLLSQVFKSQPNTEWLTNLTKAVEYGRRHNVEILELMNDFTIEIQDNSDSRSVNVAGRQRMLSQRLVKEVLELKVSTSNGEDIQDELTSLDGTYLTFASTLSAFQDGGTVPGADGQPLFVSPVTSNTSRELLSTVFDLWEPYQGLLDELIAEEVDTAWFLQLAQSIDYSREHNLTMLGLMNDLVVDLEQRATATVSRLRYIQAGAIVIALVYFFFIIFRFVGQLQQSDSLAERAREETDNILTTVQEGLFLLDRDLKIGSQFSKTTVDIFAREDLEGRTLRELLGKLVTERDLQLSADYLELFLGDHVNEKLVADINPLNQIEVNIQKDNGEFETKYLSFKFNRVLVQGKLSHILSTVSDISEKVKLERELEELKEKSNDQISMIMKILHVDSQELSNFLNRTLDELNKINQIFKDGSKAGANPRNDIDPVFRIMHKVKGDAAALGLETFESRAHSFEDMLGDLRDQEQLSGNDFLPLAVKLDDLMSHQAAVKSVADRFQPMESAQTSAAVASEPTTTASDATALASLVQRLATDQNKQVEFVQEGLETVPDIYQNPVRDMSIQLVRNSVSHGIESPAERVSGAKNETGQVHLSFQRVGLGYVLTVRDDGRGVDCDRLREKAIQMGRWEAREIESWDDSCVMNLIYEPGFSTVSVATKDAGRGVGMDVIKQMVDEIGGRIEISTTPGQYCEFQVRLPEAV